MSKHKGFTIVELLIVISVIGILASMMMVSSSESVSTARANNIISNLRNFSMAAMSFYVDSIDEFGKNPNLLADNSVKFKAQVQKRMHNEGNIPDNTKYYVKNNSGTWWAGYKFEDTESRARTKVAARTQAANLYWTSDNTTTTPTTNNYGYLEGDGPYVWMLIRSPKN